jgi:hypothetical protein
MTPRIGNGPIGLRQATAAVPATVVALTERSIKAMLLNKLQKVSTNRSSSVGRLRFEQKGPRPEVIRAEPLLETNAQPGD